MGRMLWRVLCCQECGEWLYCCNHIAKVGGASIMVGLIFVVVRGAREFGVMRAEAMMLLDVTKKREIKNNLNSLIRKILMF
jgi:hypothetical protein